MLAVISYPPIPIWVVDVFGFDLNLSLHGLFAAVGFGFGAYLATKQLGKRGFDTLKYQSALTWGLVGAIIGARDLTAPAAIMEAIENGTSILDTLAPLRGNFSIMGGFVGGIVGGAWRMRQVGLPVWATLDVSAFGLALGTIVGRIGDLAIVEHLGRSTTAWFGYGIKPGYDLAPQHDGLECEVTEVGLNGFCLEGGGIYHHVALYDMLLAGVLLFALFFVYRRFRLRYGQLFWLWVAWYGTQRFFLDFLRFGMGDAEMGVFTWNQLSGAAAAVGAIAIFWMMGRRQPVVTTEEDALRGAEVEGAAVL